MKKHLILLIIPLFGCVNAYSQKLLASDYKIFQNTPAWELAMAINAEDTAKIKQIVNHDKLLMRVVDPKYGQTLLGLAVYKQKYNSVKTLVELGADPNAFNNYNGYTPLMNAIGLGGRSMKNDPRYLNLLLKHGGNPNLASKNTDYGPGSVTPIIIAADAGNLEYVEILERAGVNLFKDESAILFGALTSRNPDLVIYLLNKGFDVKTPMHPFLDGTKTTIASMLRDWRFDLSSVDYKKKMQIVEFLKEHGIDYRKTKIPKEYYKIETKEYLERY